MKINLNKLKEMKQETEILAANRELHFKIFMLFGTSNINTDSVEVLNSIEIFNKREEVDDGSRTY